MSGSTLRELEAENSALRKTVEALTARVESLLNGKGSHFDTFAKSVTLEQIVSRRTIELKQLTESARDEAEKRKIAEELMRSERRLLRSVLAHIPYLVSWKDSIHRYLGCNASFADAVGIDSPDLISGLRDSDLQWKPVDPETLLTREASVLESGTTTLDSEESYISTDGLTRTYLVATVPMRGGRDEQIGYLSIYADITERKQLEAQLLHAQKLESIGQLAAGIAHEINTPAQYVSDNTCFLQEEFQNVLGLLELYQSLVCEDAQEQSWADRRAKLLDAMKSIDYEFLKEEIPNALEQSVEGIGRITHIVRAMKEFSHPGSSHKEPADINHAIESTVTVCSNRWKYVSNLELTLANDLPPVPCLLSEFNQVILNIIVNAADAVESRFSGSETKGEISVSTRREGNHVVIAIEDNGGGIPEHIRHKIFDPFFTTKEVGKGTGQGLAISRDVIVEKHGGKLECSIKNNDSTLFQIYMPIQPCVQVADAA
ncbi:MAG: hypothetical protein Phyf2KO_11710 [Phycisphaerales bacterium]